MLLTTNTIQHGDTSSKCSLAGIELGRSSRLSETGPANALDCDTAKLDCRSTFNGITALLDPKIGGNHCSLLRI